MFRGTTCIIDNLARLKLQGPINVRRQTEFRTVVSEVSFFVGYPGYFYKNVPISPDLGCVTLETVDVIICKLQ